MRSREPKQTSAGAEIVKGLRDTFAPIARFVEIVGEHVTLLARAFSWLPRRPVRVGNYLEACEYIGVGSLPIIVLVGLFTGMVTSLQAVNAFSLFGMEVYAGGVTGKSLGVELAPVLTALMLCGRAGAGIATEIGTMRISEQIDALESMAVNPIQFLVLPRLVAGILMAPLLCMVFFLIGMGGAYFVAVITLGVDQGLFVDHATDLMQPMDVMQGILKSTIFGLTVVLIGCYQGYNASGGGRGVGIGTTRAVVVGSVMILVLDYFLSEILLAVLPHQPGFGL